MSELNLDQRIAGLHAAVADTPPDAHGAVLGVIERYDPTLRTELGQRLGATMTLLLEHEHFAAPKSVEPKEVIEPPHEEKPTPLTPEQKLHQRVLRKYEKGREVYEADLAAIDPRQRNGRIEKQQALAHRKFIHEFADFTDISGDEHILLNHNSLIAFYDAKHEEDPEFVDALMVSCADYAERNGALVTSDPTHFATIITGSMGSGLEAAGFKDILKAVFSTRHNMADYAQINTNLGEAIFELLGNQEGLKKLLSIASLRESYTSSAFGYAPLKEATDAYLNHDLATFIDQRQMYAMMGMISKELLGESYGSNPKLEAALQKVKTEFPEAYLPDASLLGQLYKGTLKIRDFDPVRVRSLDDESILDLGLKPMPEEIEEPVQLSSLFHRRMQHFAPYAYAVAAAKEVVDERVSGGLVVLSPSTTIHIFLPSEGKDSMSLRQALDEQTSRLMNMAAKSREHGVSSHGESGILNMVYAPLFEGDEKQGIIIMRPAVPYDKQQHSSLQQLSVNYINTYNQSKQKEQEWPDMESREDSNTALRDEIKIKQKRFLGRRPIKFMMPDEVRATGLDSVDLRYDPQRGVIKSTFKLEDGEVELTLDRSFNIATDKDFVTDPAMKPHYENLILKLAKEWMCRPVVNTSEGEVSERTGKSANFGHYGYLRVVPGVDDEPPKAWKYSQDRYDACLEEQGEKLDEVDERRQAEKDAIDKPTGVRRRSTYYSESFDPTKPPLVVHYDKAAIVS